MTSWDDWHHDPCFSLQVYPTSFRTTGEAMTFVSERIGAALSPFVAQVQCACVSVVYVRVPRAHPRAKEFIQVLNLTKECFTQWRIQDFFVRGRGVTSEFGVNTFYFTRPKCA